MILVCDESVDAAIVATLRRNGLEVLYVAEMAPSLSDDRVLAEASSRGAVLVTGDRDFGELVFRQGRASAGIILIRLSGLSGEQKASIVSRAITEHASELVSAFSVISPGRLRIRRVSGADR